ncbi:MAG: hypothetical protein KDJ67_06025 [Nitratireductor sp.]|nr:hypothetical protein [Nitratireductor sp.]
MYSSVSKNDRETAKEIIRVLVTFLREGGKYISYSDLADRLGKPDILARQLGKYLDEVSRICLQNRIPNLSSIVVMKDTLNSATPMPSKDSFQNEYWPISGVKKTEIDLAQKDVHDFDWDNISLVL